MRKIPTLFRRNNQTHQVDPAITPGCEWVLRGEGRATRKVDGTGVLLRAGTAYKRREVKPGRPAPDGFELVEQDPVTKKQFGWIPIDRADPSDRYHVEAIANLESDWRTPGPDGDTYELVQLVSGEQAATLLTDDGLVGVAEYADGIGPSIQLIVGDRSRAVAARGLGLEVHPYTVRASRLPDGFSDAGVYMRHLFDDLGATGVFTDNPDLFPR